MNDFHNDAFQDILIWERYKAGINRDGVDEDKRFFHEPIEIKCLFQYNVFRTWPVTKVTDTGEEDKQSEVAIINLSYLRSLNLLDGNNKLAYSPGKDIFYHHGIKYLAAGDTDAAQAKDEPLLFYLVLRRQDDLNNDGT